MGNLLGQSAMSNTVAVLMATYNGLAWLPEQVESILGQEDVHVRLFISDDLSTDGTWDWLKHLASTDSRVTILPRKKKFGRAASNFFRLLLDADVSNSDFIAFADQDDIWELDKLRKQIEISKEGGFDGVSSGVNAFWPDGKVVPLVKSQAQRQLDYIFEAAGPGCTYLMTPRLVFEVRKILLDSSLQANDIALHDWLAYAVCRSSGWKWHIDAVSSVQYRQHGSNEIGANHGLKAKKARIKKLRSGWYRDEIIKILRVCERISPQNSQLMKLHKCMDSTNYVGRIMLLRFVSIARRKVLDRIALALLVVMAWV